MSVLRRLRSMRDRFFEILSDEVYSFNMLSKKILLKADFLHLETSGVFLGETETTDLDFSSRLGLHLFFDFFETDCTTPTIIALGDILLPNFIEIVIIFQKELHLSFQIPLN